MQLHLRNIFVKEVYLSEREGNSYEENQSKNRPDN